jgi:hypothetical protein
MLCKILADIQAKLFILRLAVYVVCVKSNRACETVQAIADCNVRNIVL